MADKGSKMSGSFKCGRWDGTPNNHEGGSCDFVLEAYRPSLIEGHDFGMIAEPGRLACIDRIGKQHARQWC